MTGKDLINYITNNHLEDAEIDMMVSDNLQFIVKIPKDITHGEKEIIYDFTRDFVYENYLSARVISYDEANDIRGINERKE